MLMYVFLGIFGALWLGLMVYFVQGFTRAVLRRKRDLRELPAWAAEHGCEFREEDGKLPRQFHLAPFDRGSLSAQMVVTSRTAERPWTAFVLRSWSSGMSNSAAGSAASSSHTSYHRVVAMWLGRPAPTFEVRPAGTITHALSNLAHGGDIEIGDQSFDRAYVVRADLPELAPLLLDGTVRAELAKDPKVGFHFDGMSLVVVRQGTDLSVAQVEEMVRLANLVLDRLPA
ncbi:hypothetical protein [Nocardioides montaniterrae]